MEFRLNKIDTDLRRRIKETTKAGKVHCKKDLNIYDNGFNEEYKDSKHKHEYEHREINSDEDVTKQKITIDAIKRQTIQVKVVKEPSTCERINCRGVFIDAKK